MILEETDLPGVLIVVSPVHRDTRGFFTETFHEARFAELGLPLHFAQDNHSRSSFNVLRGLHYQLVDPQGKLVRPARGIIFDVAVDLRRSSPNFGKWVGTTLEAGDSRQLWIPPGFAQGFVVLSDVADVTYKCTTPYHAESNRCLRWYDPDLGIRWPIPHGVQPILSASDVAAPPLSAAECYA